MTAKTICGATLALAILAGCGEKDIILPGVREDIRAAGAEETVNRAQAISLPAARVNADWTHRNGNPDHRIIHPALGASLTQIFAVNIGSGDSRRARITADPVVAGGVIYTLDAKAQVTATATSGATLWTRDLTPASDGADDASGGGVAFAAGRVYVTTGFGAVTALDAATGNQIWQQDLDAPGGSAPTVKGDLVYIVGRDSTAWALDTSNGRIRWQASGTPSLGNFSGGAGAAVTNELAIFPYPSGEVSAVFAKGGLKRWGTVVSGERLGNVASNISDITGDPVVDGNRVYVSNISGRMVALDLETGERIWTAVEGAVSPVWPTGGSVFMVNDLAQLIRLDATDGSVIWRMPLPNLVERRGLSRAVTAHYGPILAGGRLIVASSDGLIRQFDPATGNLVGSVSIPGGAASNPVVAGNTLYVVSKSGQLLAFR